MGVKPYSYDPTSMDHPVHQWSMAVDRAISAVNATGLQGPHAVVFTPTGTRTRLNAVGETVTPGPIRSIAMLCTGSGHGSLAIEDSKGIYGVALPHELFSDNPGFLALQALVRQAYEAAQALGQATPFLWLMDDDIPPEHLEAFVKAMLTDPPVVTSPSPAGAAVEDTTTADDDGAIPREVMQ